MRTPLHWNARPWWAITWGLACLAFIAHGCGRTPHSSGTVLISSTPAGATVFVDNHFVGITPCIVRDLTPGIHSVKMERSGYKRYYGLVNIWASTARFDAILEAERSCEIHLSSVPTDAAIYLNGQYRGRTPARFAGLPAGSYEIRLLQDNYAPWQKTVLLRTGEKITISAELESPTEKFLRGAITKTPEEVTYYVELARHYIARKKYDQAIAVYKMGLQRRDKRMDPRLYTEMGRAYGGQFKSAEDEEDIETLRSKIVHLFAETGNALTFYSYALKGIAQRKRTLTPEAEKVRQEKIQKLELYLAQNPDDLRARLDLGNLYLDKQDTKRAQEQFKFVAQATAKNWMTEEEKRQEAAQRAKGLVKVDGRWLTPQEAERIAQAKRVALEQQAARQRAEQLAREQAKRQAEELAKRLTEHEAAARANGLAYAPKAFASHEPEWVVDTFKAGMGWHIEKWADPAVLKVVSFGPDKALSITYTGGKCAKACISRQLPEPVDISSRRKLEVEVVNNSKSLAMLSLLITAEQDYESLPQFVAPGRHRRLVFPIYGKHFKCKQDNWAKYVFAIAQPAKITRLGLILNNPVELLVKDIKLTR